MRIEHFPIILGVLIGLIGAGLIADAWVPDDTFVPRERRRRQRAERHRGGEALVGIGTLCLAAALIGRDTWRYGTLAVIVGTLLLVAGGILNRRFLRELVVFRGPARRAPAGASPVATPERERPVERAAEPTRVRTPSQPGPAVGGPDEPRPKRPRIR